LVTQEKIEIMQQNLSKEQNEAQKQELLEKRSEKATIYVTALRKAHQDRNDVNFNDLLSQLVDREINYLQESFDLCENYKEHCEKVLTQARMTLSELEGTNTALIAMYELGEIFPQMVEAVQLLVSIAERECYQVKPGISPESSMELGKVTALLTKLTGGIPKEENLS